MWDVQKFDIRGSTEREEKKKEEILKVFEDLGETAGRCAEPPDFPPWESPGDGRGMEGLLKRPRKLF
jgi:hypothetical protein